MFFGESHEEHETSVDEEKNLEIDDALKVFGENWSSGRNRNRGFVWINLCLPSLPKKDVVALLPAGFGKSIIYQILPQIHKNRGDDKNVLLAVTPLNYTIMNEQTRMLRERGMRATILRDSAQQRQS